MWLRQEILLTGLLRGNEMLPDERTATAGRATLRVLPNGYTKDMDLWIMSRVTLLDNNYLLSLHTDALYLDSTLTYLESEDSIIH